MADTTLLLIRGCLFVNFMWLVKCCCWLVMKALMIMPLYRRIKEVYKKHIIMI